MISISAADTVSITVLIEKIVDGESVPGNLARITMKPHYTVSQLYTALKTQFGEGDLVLHHEENTSFHTVGKNSFIAGPQSKRAT
jgi:hypothetical protein